MIDIIFHICTSDAWAEAQARGEYRAASLATEGFLHGSTAGQVAPTANRWFHGQSGLVLLSIDCKRVAAPIQYEEVYPGQLFPHIYGPLNLDAVIAVRDFEPRPDGTFAEPT